MTFYSENPGRPTGSRPELDGILIDRALTQQWSSGSLPWVQGEKCTSCPKTANGCYQHTIGKPKRTIPGGPGPDADLPCVGKWDLFDADEVSTEVRDLCASCPFAAWCLETATTNKEHGIWAGTTYEDRRTNGRKVAA